MAGYLKREAMLFKGIDRAIAAAPPGATPNVLDIGANHGIFAIFAALRGAKVAAVEAQAALASLVKVSALANGVDVEVYHNAVFDVPAVVEICVEINQGVGCTRQFFTKPSFGDDAAVLARSWEPASRRHRAGVASWRGGRRDDSARTLRKILISTWVEIAELGAANDFNEGGTASLGAARMASQDGEVGGGRHSMASGLSPARSSALIDFLKIDVEGVEIPALRSSLELLGRGGVRDASVEFGPAKRWAESETHGVAGANPAAAVDVLHKIDAAGYDAYLTWGRFCVPR